MNKFTQLSSKAIVIPNRNIDTDQIIPARFLKVTDKNGLGDALFSDWRYNDDGNINSEFVLNQEYNQGSQILIAGDNFGCGSSREHAPWALLDFGIKVIVSQSFADIFYNNCFKNGILPIVANEKIIEELAEYFNRKENIEVKLVEQEIIYGNKSYKFEVDSFKKKCLLEGLDDIALSLEKIKRIENFETKMAQSKSWV